MASIGFQNSHNFILQFYTTKIIKKLIGPPLYFFMAKVFNKKIFAKKSLD